MGWLQIVGAILTIAIKLFDLWHTNEEEKKKQNKEALSEAIEAIDKRDISQLNRSIQRML